MKARLIFTRNLTAQYSAFDYAMEKETKSIVVNLEGLEQDKEHNAGEWQIVGYEEIKE